MEKESAVVWISGTKIVKTLNYTQWNGGPKRVVEGTVSAELFSQQTLADLIKKVFIISLDEA